MSGKKSTIKTIKYSKDEFDRFESLKLDFNSVNRLCN